MRITIALIGTLIAFAAAARSDDFDKAVTEYLPRMLASNAISSLIKDGIYFDGDMVVLRQDFSALDGREATIRAKLCRAEADATASFARQCATDETRQSDAVVRIVGRDIDTARTETALGSRILGAEQPVDASDPKAVVDSWTREPPSSAALAVTFHCRGNAQCVSARARPPGDTSQSVFENGRWNDEELWAHSSTFTLYCNGEEPCRELIAKTTQVFLTMSEARD